MCNTAPNNVVAANVGKDVTVIYQADGKRAHIPSVRNDGIVVIAGKVTINIAVVIRAVDVESVSIACTIRFAVVNFFAVAAVSNRPNLVAITSAGVNRHIAAIIGSSATFHVQIVIPADRFVTNVVSIVTIIEIGKGGNSQGAGHCQSQANGQNLFGQGFIAQILLLMRFCDLGWFRSRLVITRAPVMTITSRGQFPGSLTLSCMRTIAYCIQNFQKNVTKSKNTAQMQKLPAADDESAAGSFCFNYLYQASRR